MNSMASATEYSAKKNVTAVKEIKHVCDLIYD